MSLALVVYKIYSMSIVNTWKSVISIGWEVKATELRTYIF